MKKVIKLEMYFDDGFVPPEKFHEPTKANNWNSKCELCPFYEEDYEYSYGRCVVTAVVDTAVECPIRKFF